MLTAGGTSVWEATPGDSKVAVVEYLERTVWWVGAGIGVRW